MERKEAERKAYEEKMMAEWETDRKEGNADFQKERPNVKPMENN